MKGLQAIGNRIGERYRTIGHLFLDIIVACYLLTLPLIFLSPALAPFLILPLIGLLFLKREAPYHD